MSTYTRPEDIFLLCDCHSSEHQIIIHKDDDGDENWPQAYCSIHLTNGGFFNRVRTAFKHIFGYTSKFGDWDEFCFKPEHAPKLRDLANYLEKIK